MQKKIKQFPRERFFITCHIYVLLLSLEGDMDGLESPLDMIKIRRVFPDTWKERIHSDG
jgi:hypothetical protein